MIEPSNNPRYCTTPAHRTGKLNDTWCVECHGPVSSTPAKVIEPSGEPSTPEERAVIRKIGHEFDSQNMKPNIGAAIKALRDHVAQARADERERVIEVMDGAESRIKEALILLAIREPRPPNAWLEEVDEALAAIRALKEK
jgi:hypothetical protein